MIQRWREALAGFGAVALLSVALLSAAAGAQVSVADSLLRAGRLTDAEELYYATSDARPRDPEARAALGRYLASRGATRIGAVLLEEARQFGGDRMAIATALAPLYRELGDFHALLTLPAGTLSNAERAQAAWLLANPPGVSMPESIVVKLRPSVSATALARTPVRLGDVDMDATLDARRTGVTLDTTWRRRSAALFGGDRSHAPLGAIPSLTIGALTLSNVPVHFAPLGRRRVSIGIDVLERFAPEFDGVSEHLVLRSSGALPASARGERIPTLADGADLRVLADGRFEPLSRSALLGQLRARRWALDAARGALVLEP